MAKRKIPMGLVCAVGPDGQSQLLGALRKVGNSELPVRTFYWLNRVRATLEQEHAHFEAARVRLYQKLGEPQRGHNGQVEGYKVPEDKMEEFGREVHELINHEIELPVEEGLKLPLPTAGVGNDWYVLMTALPIFDEPGA